MGVPGFASYLERELAGRKPPLQEVPRDGPCLVDGSGLAFYLLKELGKDAHRDLGGVYEAARAATKAFLRRLLATTREIWVVADGKASHEAMAATKTRRKLAREEKFYKLYAYLELGEAPASHDDLPVPPLWMDQFYATVDSVQREMQDRAHPDSGPIHLLRAAGEADELLAAMCQNLAQTQSHQAAGAFILAQDTDFYFVANARYVPLNSLENGCCRVYTRAWLADALRVPDHAMTELALAIGNDYVEGWNIKMRSAAERVAVIVKKFRKGQNRVRAVPSFIAKSDGAKFSRVFYNNKVFPNFNFANDIPKPHQEKPAFRRISADGKLRDLIDLPPFVGSAGGKLTTSQVVAQVRTLQWFCTETILEKVPEMDLEAVSAETALAWVDATISKMWASFAQVGLVNLKYHMTMRSWNRYCAVYAYQLLYYNLVRRVMPVAPSATCEALPGMDVTKCGLSDARRFPLMAQCRADCEVQALRCISRKLPKDWKQVREPLTLLSAAAAAATSKSHAKGLRKPLTPRRAKRDHRLQVSPGPKEKANYWGPLAESSDDDEDDR